MESRCFKTIFALTLITVFGFAVSTASASRITLDFEDEDLAESSVSDKEYGGFQWGEDWALGDTDNLTGYEDAVSSGSRFLYNYHKDGGIRTLVVKRDTPFDFLGGVFAVPTSSSQAFELLITAKDANENKIGQSVYMDFFFEKSFNIDVVFEGVSKLEFYTSGSIYTMDDFTYRDIETEVNEAGGLILLGIGLVGLWAARRRIRA